MSGTHANLKVRYLIMNPLNHAMHALRLSTFAALLMVFATLVLNTAAADTEDGTATNALEALLFEKLAIAPDEKTGRSAESEIWEYWFDLSPTPEIRNYLDTGRERREAYAYDEAEENLDKVVELAPDYHEGYNQRAFVRFLRENYEGSLKDLEKTLELEPKHFGALSGMYHVLRIQNRPVAALNALKEAVDLHPWIQERHGLPEQIWPDSFRAIHKPGQEI